MHELMDGWMEMQRQIRRMLGKMKEWIAEKVGEQVTDF